MELWQISLYKVRWKMNRLLIIYTKMVVGGSTTSLLSLLQNLDYKKVSVDLQLLDIGGELFHLIPSEVNILSPKSEYIRYKKVLFLHRVFSFSYIKDLVYSRIIAKKQNNALLKQQIMSYQSVRLSEGIEQVYDVAIGFLEFWPTAYVAHKVKAKKKVSWIHIDYINTGLIKSVDQTCYDKIDEFVLVSESCYNGFIKVFPEYLKKTRWIENIQNSDYIRKQGNVYLGDIRFKELIKKNRNNNIIFTTTCRIVEAKGLQRAINAFSKIYKDNNNFFWYILGDGPYINNLKELIIENRLEKQIILLGSKVNPFPYLKEADYFLLPSFYEGKPMSVTEAMILGVVPLVAEYPSAHQQVDNGVNGIIVLNNEESIGEGIRRVIEDKKLHSILRNSVIMKDYSNNDAIKFVYKLFDT